MVWAERARGMNVPAKRELAAQLAPRHSRNWKLGIWRPRCRASSWSIAFHDPLPETGEAWRPAARASGFPVDSRVPDDVVGGAEGRESPRGTFTSLRRGQAPAVAPVNRRARGRAARCYSTLTASRHMVSKLFTTSLFAISPCRSRPIRTGSSLSPTPKRSISPNPASTRIPRNVSSSNRN